MIRRITLVNFMSHARTVIEPADGLTVLVGPNNCGKSAVVAALQILCHNDNSTYVTRHNERECTVTVETSDGHVVEWCRKNNSPRYAVDGEVFDRLGRGAVPDGLHQLLRLPKVTAEGNQEFDVHFGEQKSPVFLLDKPGSHAAQFFASSSDAASLVEMQKRHQQKMTEARRERAQLDIRAERLAGDLAILAAADDINIQVEQVEIQHAALVESSAFILQATEDALSLRSAIAVLEHRAAETGALGPLQAPPVLSQTDPLAQMIEQLTRTCVDSDRESGRANALISLQPAPSLADEKPLADLICAIKSARFGSDRIDAECAAIRQIPEPPMMEDAKALSTIARDLNSASQEVAVQQSKLAALLRLTTPPELASEARLAEDLRAFALAITELDRAHTTHERLVALVVPPQLVDPSNLSQVLQDIERQATIVASRQQEAELADRSLKQAEQDLRHWAEVTALCPTCGGTLDPNRLVAHAGSSSGGEAHA